MTDLAKYVTIVKMKLYMNSEKLVVAPRVKYHFCERQVNLAKFRAQGARLEIET